MLLFVSEFCGMSTRLTVLCRFVDDAAMKGEIDMPAGIVHTFGEKRDETETKQKPWYLGFGGSLSTKGEKHLRGGEVQTPKTGRNWMGMISKRFTIEARVEAKAQAKAKSILKAKAKEEKKEPVRHQYRMRAAQAEIDMYGSDGDVDWGP